MRGMSETALPFVVAFIVPVAVHQFVGWWLDSSVGVVVTLALLFVLGAIFAIGHPPRPWHRAGALCIGAFVGSAVMLVWSGPGTIWPIVLVFAAALLTAAAMAGAGLARWGTALTQRR